MHVHVFSGEGEAVINIEDDGIIKVWEMPLASVKQAREIVAENREMLAEKWREIHG